MANFYEWVVCLPSISLLLLVWESLFHLQRIVFFRNLESCNFKSPDALSSVRPSPPLAACE